MQTPGRKGDHLKDKVFGEQLLEDARKEIYVRNSLRLLFLSRRRLEIAIGTALGMY